MLKISKTTKSKSKKSSKIPLSFKPYLWSYDFKKLDIQKDKKTIILSILYNGNLSDWKKIFTIYGKEETRKVFSNSKKDTWNKKSVNFWTSQFN